jgi:tetratricopeptide (TPR) repeat protein
MRLRPDRSFPASTAVFALWIALPASASAQPAEPTTPEAQAADAFERGSALFQEQNWAGALAAFQRAYDLQPHYSVLFNIGFCLKSLQRYPEALEALERYLAEGGEQVRPEKRAQAEQAIADLRTFISRVTVTTDVDGAEIVVNGQARGTSPLAAPLVLGAGHYVIEARAPERGDARSEFDLGPGEERTVALALEPLDAVPPPPPDNPPPAGPPASDAPSWYEDWLGWTLGGVGIVAGAAGGLLLTDVQDTESKAEREANIQTARSMYEDADAERVGSIVLMAAGGALLVTGIVLLAIPEGSASPEETEGSGVAVVPFFGPAGVGLAGTF